MSAVPASSQAGVLDIACEGTESTGGGTTQYQYTLHNTIAAPIVLKVFYIGTMDLSPANYTNWVAPAGFTATATVANWVTLSGIYPVSVMATTMTKTPHGIMPPQLAFAAPGGVLWQGSQSIPGGGTATFGFDNPHMSVDVEWLAEHPDPVNSSQGFLSVVIAGPLGVYTQGWVHAPGTEPVPVDADTWGKVKALYR
jgi:hypothetical protein